MKYEYKLVNGSRGGWFDKINAWGNQGFRLMHQIHNDGDIYFVMERKVNNEEWHADRIDDR